MIYITHGKIHDVNILDNILMEPGAIYIMDRGYLDFARLYMIHQERAFFVIRSKTNFNFKRLYSHPTDKSTGVQCDQSIVLRTFYPKRDYPEKLRRIRFFDTEKKKRLVFLTNNFSLPAITIAQLYRCRWQVELFFKWIKQTPQNQGFLRHIRECREDPSLDRDLCLRPGRHREEASENRTESLHNSTDFECHPIRENPVVTGALELKLRKTGYQWR
jgi:hypothetical protein